MPTNSHTTFGGARRRSFQVLVLVAAAGLIGAGHSKTLPVYDEDADDGRDPAQVVQRPTVEAAFPLESYGPNMVARLFITDTARRVTVQILRAGPEHEVVRANDQMTGVPVNAKRLLGRVSGRRT
jgi:hypothetical protein